jgi:ankyrin repeat protein
MKERLVRFNLEATMIALLHNDYDTFNEQLNLLSKRSGRVNISQMIKNVGIQHPELNNEDQFSFILIAGYMCNKEAFERLLSLGGYVNQQNNWGRTPLMLAGLSGNDDMIRYLLSKGADASKKDFYDHTLKSYIPYKTKNFISAITEGNKFFIKLYRPELKVAKKRGNRLVIIESINEEFKNPEDETVTPLMAIAAKTKFEANPEADEDHKYDKDRQYYANLAGKLIGMGIKVNQQNKYGRTALMYATMAENGLMMQTLRESGANPDLHDSQHKTMRHHSKGREKRINETAATHTPETHRKYDLMPLE